MYSLVTGIFIFGGFFVVKAFLTFALSLYEVCNIVAMHESHETVMLNE